MILRPATVNGIIVSAEESPDTLIPDTLIPATYPDGYSREDLGYEDPYGEDSGPVTLRSPSFGQFPVSPSFSHWPEEELCAPSSAGLCSATC